MFVLASQQLDETGLARFFTPKNSESGIYGGAKGNLNFLYKKCKKSMVQW